MNSYRAAEKINDLFMVSLSDLESNIVSNIIKSSSQPSRLIEETQQTINDYKQRFYNSLIQLITYISQQISMNPKELQKIAESLEQELIKYKQKHLLFQMKAILNTKIKALLDTLENTNQMNKNEIQKSIHALTDSLAKIEQTLQCTPSSPNHITPIQMRQEHSSLSLTPNLSDDAENKVKQNFITPKQGNVVLVHNNHTPGQHSPQTSGLHNRTINSFNNEHDCQHFQRENNLHDHINSLLNMEFNRNRKFETEFFQEDLVESVNIEKSNPVKKQARKYSVQSINSNSQNTPSEHKKFHSTKTKDLIKRNQQMPESVNLLTKLNQAEEKDKKKKIVTVTNSKIKSNKENVKVSNRQQVKTVIPQKKK